MTRILKRNIMQTESYNTDEKLSDYVSQFSSVSKHKYFLVANKDNCKGFFSKYEIKILQR